MKYQTFGKTGLEISKIALGTWGMGGCGWDNYDEEIKAVIKVFNELLDDVDLEV